MLLDWVAEGDDYDGAVSEDEQSDDAEWSSTKSRKRPLANKRETARGMFRIRAFYHFIIRLPY